MREFNLTITNDFDGCDIKFILRSYWRLSNKLITRLKNGDGILLNGKKEFVTKSVHTGDFLSLRFPEESSPGIIPEDIPLDILYEDDDILAVNKPGNMPTHPSHGHFGGTLANAVMHYYRDIPFTFRAVTRLDRDTSGVIIIAKNAPSADRLSKQLAAGQFSKEYIAVCVGIPVEMKGTIDAPIKRAAEGIIKRCISEDGKKAVSNYEVSEALGGFSLIRLFPQTGRTHQLRLHLSYIGMPIYADFLYGIDVPGERIRLHCRRTCFTHPFTGENVEITAPIPRDMELADITFSKSS